MKNSLIIRAFIFAAALSSIFLFGCSSGGGENNDNGDEETAETDKDKDVDAREYDEELKDEEPAIEEEPIVEDDAEEDVSTEEDAEPEIEESLPPCNGACQGNDLCHEQIKSGTCLKNCNTGENGKIADAFCYAQTVGEGQSAFDFFCRADGQCRLTEFGETCASRSQKADEGFVIDCSAACQKMTACSPGETGCLARCNSGSYEWGSNFSARLGECFTNTQDCGQGGNLGNYCFGKVFSDMQTAGEIPTYAADGCSAIKTYLETTCKGESGYVNGQYQTCQIMGAALQRAYFEKYIECGKGDCADFEKCAKQSNCVFSR